MADQFDRLDELIDAVLSRPSPALLTDAELAPLVGLAAELRDLPSHGFKQRLREDLQRRASMTPTSVNPIRKGFHTLTPYLISHQGTALIDFITRAFGAVETLRVPGSAGGFHSEFRIGDSMIMLGGAPTIEPSPVALHFYVPDVDQAYRRAVEAGGTSLYPPTDHEYGERGAAVRDLSGNGWYLATHRGPKYVPEGLRDVTIYLHPVGAPKMIDFLQRAFAAELLERHDAEGRVAHAKLRIGDSIIEMSEPHGLAQPSEATLHMYVPDTDALYRRALEAGATSLAEPADQPYGDRRAGVRDPFGNRWYIATQIREAQP